jgi:hypothetical protein
VKGLSLRKPSFSRDWYESFLGDEKIAVGRVKCARGSLGKIDVFGPNIFPQLSRSDFWRSEKIQIDRENGGEQSAQNGG